MGEGRDILFGDVQFGCFAKKYIIKYILRNKNSFLLASCCPNLAGFKTKTKKIKYGKSLSLSRHSFTSTRLILIIFTV
jgi:hypothetical protein